MTRSSTACAGGCGAAHAGKILRPLYRTPAPARVRLSNRHGPTIDVGDIDRAHMNGVLDQRRPLEIRRRPTRVRVEYARRRGPTGPALSSAPGNAVSRRCSGRSRGRCRGRCPGCRSSPSDRPATDGPRRPRSRCRLRRCSGRPPRWGRRRLKHRIGHVVHAHISFSMPDDGLQRILRVGFFIKPPHKLLFELSLYVLRVYFGDVQYFRRFARS